MAKITPITAPRRTPLFVGVAIRRGSQRITTILAPALRVVREDGRPPRIEFVTPSDMGMAS